MRRKDTRRTDTCHKTRVARCEGRLLDPRRTYGTWAYWCKDRHIAGWTSSPCMHQVRA